MLCWASGFVVPRAFAPYIEPLTFVAIRNGAAAIVLVIVALALRSSWPDKWSDRAGLLWAGALLQGFSLMAVYWTIVHGLQVGVAALIGALQPALTAMLAAWLLGEALSRCHKQQIASRRDLCRRPKRGPRTQVVRCGSGSARRDGSAAAILRAFHGRLWRWWAIPKACR